MLVDGADAVGVAVGAEAGVAVVGDHDLLEGPDVRLDRLGIDAREQGVDVAADLDVVDAEARKDVGEDGAAGAVHGVDGELEARPGNQVEVGEALDGLQVVGQEVELTNGGWLAGTGNGLAEEAFDLGNDGGLARPAVPGLVLHAVPLRGVVRGGNHDAARSVLFAHAVAQGGGGGDVVGEQNGNAGGGEDFRAGAGEGLRSEAAVVADADASGGVNLIRT